MCRGTNTARFHQPHVASVIFIIHYFLLMNFISHAGDCKWKGGKYDAAANPCLSYSGNKAAFTVLRQERCEEREY